MIVRATRDRLIDVLQRCGVDPHNHFTRARRGIGEILTTRRLSERVQYRSLHGVFPFLFAPVTNEANTPATQRSLRK